MASEDIGALFNTKIPGYDDPADIQDALKLFLYGSTTYDETNTDPNNLLTPSLAKHLQTIKDRAELGTGSDYLTETEVENLTPTDGYIWVDVNSTGNGHPIYATAVYTNEAPTTGLADGIIWVDKNASPQRAYIYDAGTSTWVLINELLNIVDASGDLIYGTGADTVGRLPIGSVGKVLKVSSSNLPAWENENTYSLPAQSGNAGKFLTTDGTQESWASVTSGAVVQVKSYSHTPSEYTTTTSSTYQNTNQTLTITPTNANNKILVIASFQMYSQGNNSIYDTGTLVNLVRNSTQIADTSNYFYHGNGTYRTDLGTSTIITYLDSPATTSPVTYKNQVKISMGSPVGSSTFTPQTITLMEVTP